MLHIALFEPQIAPNTGNIIRLCANLGAHLHLIEPLGFDLTEKKLRRAGLDYHDLTQVSRHENYTAFSDYCDAQHPQSVRYAITSKGRRGYHQVNYQADDVLVFGAETHGLSPAVQRQFDTDHQLRIPMAADSRTLNLSNAVAVVSYEAWRQLNFIEADQSDGYPASS